MSEKSEEEDKDYVSEATKSAIKAAWIARARIEAFDFAMRDVLYISNRFARAEEVRQLRAAVEVLRGKLYRESEEALRRLLTFAFMSQDKEILSEVAALIRDTHFRVEDNVRSTIIHYLQDDVRNYPSRWRSDVEKGLSDAVHAALDKMIQKGDE